MNNGRKKSNKNRIAVVIVTYNRKQLLGECLEALLNQTYPLDALYIIDNASADGTPEYLVDKGLIDKPIYPDKNPLEETKTIPLLQFPDKTIEVHYVRMHENTGGAGGFHEGVKRAYQGYDWLWLMDDDVLPYKNTIEGLINEVLVHNGRVIVPITITAVDNSINKNLGLLFAGGLLSCEVFKTIGLPRPEFFIYFDDLEFEWRMNNANIKILQSTQGAVKHTDWISQPKKSRKILWRTITRPVIPHWKIYYYARNGIYMQLIYRKYCRALYMATFQNSKLILAYFFLGSYREIPLIIKGSLDGLLRRMGKRI
jgi:rhamnopyranosyl-N-acetylglucosaminyl-diphospho-decaprenol beta-1,3/1,4-galactofuranosyltransferase